MKGRATYDFFAILPINFNNFFSNIFTKLIYFGSYLSLIKLSVGTSLS